MKAAETSNSQPHLYWRVQGSCLCAHPPCSCHLFRTITYHNMTSSPGSGSWRDDYLHPSPRPKIIDIHGNKDQSHWIRNQLNKIKMFKLIVLQQQFQIVHSYQFSHLNLLPHFSHGQKELTVDIRNVSLPVQCCQCTPLKGKSKVVSILFYISAETCKVWLQMVKC